MDARIEELANGRVIVRLALSRRNLTALLAKLDERSADRTIWRDIGAGVLIVVSAEEDATHYVARQGGAAPPGPDAPLSPN